MFRSVFRPWGIAALGEVGRGLAGRGWLLEKGCRDRQAAHLMLSLLSEIVLVLLSASIKEPGFSWREMCKRQRRRHFCTEKPGFGAAFLARLDLKKQQGSTSGSSSYQCMVASSPPLGKVITHQKVFPGRWHWGQTLLPGRLE